MRKNILLKSIFLFAAIGSILLLINFSFYNQNNEVLAQRFLGQEFEEKCVIDPEIENGFERGKIPAGEMVDGAELLVSSLIENIETLIEAVTKESSPVYNKNKEEGFCFLYDLPPRCQCYCLSTPCEEDTYYHGCGCYCTDVCECVGGVVSGDDDDPICCPPDAEKCDLHPCPMTLIEKRTDEVKEWYEEEDASVAKTADHIINLIEGANLEENEPNRTDLLNKLANSRDKLEKCITGYGKVLKTEMTNMTFLNCEIALDTIALGELVILPGFKYLTPTSSDLCYPYNSEHLTDDERQICEKNKDSPECIEIIEDLMQNFFCCEEVRD